MAKLRAMTDLQKLACDIYAGKVEQYSVGEAEDKLRDMLIEKIGGEWNYLNFQKNKWDVYAIIQELLSINITNLTVDSFGNWVEVRDFNLGDKIEFYVENKEMFKISHISTGNNNIRRQRLLDSKIPTTAYKLGVKIYEEFDRFVAGRISFAKLVDKVAKSFEQEIALHISGAVQSAYKSVNANLVVKATYNDDKLAELIAKIKARTNQEVSIYGTSLAISKIKKSCDILAETDKMDNRSWGYVKVFNGCPVIELPQVYNEAANEWSVRNDLLYIVPNGEKLVKLGFEGQAMVIEDTTGTRLDQTIEYMFQRKMHLAVCEATVFGAYEIL